MTDNFKFDLGEKVEDELSGFEGVVTVRSQHLTGCDRYCVRPAETDDDGSYPDSTWFDEQRLQSQEDDSGIQQSIRNIFRRTNRGSPGPSEAQDTGKPTP